MYHVPTLFLAYKYLQYHWTCSVLLVGRSATIEKYAVCKAFHMSVCSIIKMFLFSLFAGMFGICHTNKIQFTVSQTLHATLFLYQTSSCSMCNFYGNCLEKNIIFIFTHFFINLLTCFLKLFKSKRACLFIRFFHFPIAHPCKDVSFCTHVTSLYSFSKASIFITTILNNNSKSLKRSNDISFFSFSRMFRNYLSLPGVTKDNYLRYKL